MSAPERVIEVGAEDVLAAVRTEAASKAILEFVEWVATSRAYNGSDHHTHAQSLYNEQINDALPQWAREFIDERLLATTQEDA